MHPEQHVEGNSEHAPDQNLICQDNLIVGRHAQRREGEHQNKHDPESRGLVTLVSSQATPF